ncbi:MAG TPA: discoidin domain-containing protein [Verrucomicrobiae bacterium]|nr:discoidin domain-containing protein [Verrucomicrobiae bacterium]
MPRSLMYVISMAALCLATASSFAVSTISLAGEWRFALDRSDAGLSGKWFNAKLPDKIRLPGILESQGYGDKISISTPWVLSLYDHGWYLRADYAAYTNDGDVKVPFLCQPPRHYLGAAWYQRNFNVPREWKDKRIVLFLERPHWKTTVWLDNHELGSDVSLCTPHQYDLGAVAPGKHRLTICVDNRMILPYRPDAHSVSDSLDDAWNGIVGKIELRATAPVWIDDVRIIPDAEKKSIHARMTLHNFSGVPASGKISFCVDSVSGTRPIDVLPSSENFNDLSDTNTSIEEDFNLGADAELWSEFSPALYCLRVDVAACSDDVLYDEQTAHDFGLRDFHAAGNQFILNGRPIYFRGTHFGGDFPLNGYPAMDVESWKRIFGTCRQYGLNHMRFHSWCPPEAAFQAADELGFYLQIECGMWNSFDPGGVMEKQLYSETEQIIRDYGNHPSLMLVSASNEAHGRWQQVLPRWVKHFRAEDPRHLYTPDTGWALIESPDEPIGGGADYLVVGRIGSNHVRGPGGWFGGDYRDAIGGINVPVIGHEVGQWCAYPDFDVIKKFTGFMEPGNFEIFRNSAAAHGVLEMDKNFARASGRFQVECYKEEIEANLRTPGLDGFQLLDLHDYTGQGTALVGLLDPFWLSKGYTTPDEFRKFCNPVVPLARLKKRVFTTADPFEALVEIANFGESTLTNGVLSWEIRNAVGFTVKQGAFPTASIPIGKGFAAGEVSADLSKLTAPGAYKLVVRLDMSGRSDRSDKNDFANDWNFWVYPAQISNAVPDNIFVTRSWSDAEKKLASGGKVLFLPRNEDLDWSSPPLGRVPVFWNALMGPTWSRMLGLWCDTNHPALAEFPTEANCDWQWTDLLRNTRAVNLDNLPCRLRPIVWAIDDWNRNYKLAVVFEASVGAGKLMVCSIDLDKNASPVARQLRRSLLDYMAGVKFQPKTTISTGDFEGLYFDTRIMRELGASALADGSPADDIIDGDPNTFWSSTPESGDHGRAELPFRHRGHEIEITFPQPVPMTGLVLMPRQNRREHQGDIREFKIQASDDGTNWQDVVSGQLSSTFDEQKLLFGKTVSTKNLKLIALSGFGSDHSMALAELAVIYAGPKLAANDSGGIKYKNVRTASPDIDGQ